MQIKTSDLLVALTIANVVADNRHFTGTQAGNFLGSALIALGVPLEIEQDDPPITDVMRKMYDLFHKLSKDDATSNPQKS